jgi:RNA polymerase sigma factor (sigma-70 family)
MDPSVIRCEAASTGSPFARAHDMKDPDPAAEPGEVDHDDHDERDDLEAAGVEPRCALPRAASEALDNEALAALVGRVMRQDEAALATLYEQLSGRVYAVALHITRQVACAEEVLQDTFWQIWRQAPRFDPQRGSAIAWVLTMARSRALDAARTLARGPVQIGHPVADDDVEFTDASVDDPLDLLDAVQRDSALHAQLALLDPLRRQLIALAFFRGMTQDEIAEHTGLPLGTVKSHFRRTLAALHAALGPEFNLAPVGVVR